jgi:hypothetical protein
MQIPSFHVFIFQQLINFAVFNAKACESIRQGLYKEYKGIGITFAVKTILTSSASSIKYLTFFVMIPPLLD